MNYAQLIIFTMYIWTKIRELPVHKTIIALYCK